MDFYFDSRSDVDRTSAERADRLSEEAARVSDALPGDTHVSVVSFDRSTGNPAVVVTHRPEPGGEDFVQRALEHVQQISPALGLTAEQPPEFRADPAVQRTSSGSAVVHLRQLYKGIPIYEASETVRFDPEGRLTEVAGRSHTVVGDIPVSATVEASEALVVAARHLVDVIGGEVAMRDAVLVAARDRALAAGMSAAEAEELRAGIWAAFARYGMGPGASSVEATLGPVVADFSTPPRHQTGPIVRQTRAARLPIPDNDPRGIASSMTLDGGAIVRLSLAVEIRHPYRGDLVVRLRAPGGDPFPLHSRTGGGADDLKATWTTDDALLAPLVGRPVAGEWTLEVVDRAKVDVGTLESWTLEVETSAARPVVSGAAAPGVTIPDNAAAGISSTIDLAGTGPVRQLRLDLDLTHTFVGDLVVALTGPTGEKAVIHDQTGGGTDNLIASFDSDTGPLSAFVGLPVGGRWTLEVADLARRDIGKLNRWALEAAL